MHNAARSLLIALTAALLLAIATGSANASSGIEVAPAELTITSVILATEGSGSGNSISCAVTLSGSVHRTIAKNTGALAGNLTEGSLTGCVSEIPWVRLRATAESFPWHIRYVSFSGTLPEVTSLRTTVLGVNILIDFVDAGFGLPAMECLYRGDIELAGRGTAVNEITRFTIQEGSVVELGPEREGVLEETLAECAQQYQLTGTFSASRIALRLI